MASTFHILPHGEPLPRDRMFWIVTDEGDAVEVAYSDSYQLYTGRETYCRQDGESGSWEPDEIFGWSDSFEAAEVQAAVVGAAQ